MSAKYHEQIRRSRGRGISGEYTTHMTTHVIVGTNNINYVGIAECSDSDEFEKKKGTNIARGRAEKAMAIGNGWIEGNGSFRDVYVMSPSGTLVEGRIWEEEEVIEEVDLNAIELKLMEVITAFLSETFPNNIVDIAVSLQ